MDKKIIERLKKHYEEIEKEKDKISKSRDKIRGIVHDINEIIAVCDEAVDEFNVGLEYIKSAIDIVSEQL